LIWEYASAEARSQTRCRSNPFAFSQHSCAKKKLAAIGAQEAIMNHKILLILGGYGGVGRPLAWLLLQETDVRLVMAGRTVEKAQAVQVCLILGEGGASEASHDR